MNKIELEEIIHLHQLWLKNNGDDSKADLCRANLSGANLHDSDLNGTNLRKANLHYADLRRADLRGANLRDSDLRKADLRKADLRDSDLSEADLHYADLSGADLRGANLDFSCFPLWRGGLNIKIDDRLAYQLIFHLTGQDISSCNEQIQEWISNIPDEIKNGFKTFNNDI